MNAGQPSKGGGETSEQNMQNNTLLLDEDIMRQEVMWVLGRLKGKAALEGDGLTAEMINNDILVDVWYEYFKPWHKFSVCALQDNAYDCKGKTGPSSRRIEIAC